MAASSNPSLWDRFGPYLSLLAWRGATLQPLNPVVSSHIGLLPGSERLPEISCPFRSTHQQYPVLPWHCTGS